MKTHVLRPSLLLAFALLGCHEKAALTLPAQPASSAASSAPRSPSPAPPPAPAPVADPIVDLLHTVDCTVAVSSKVDNPLDFPEHLVDGKPETAWNGKTGDLNGYIAFRVPRSARVLRVELTAGYDKVGPKGDLFTMNHRITRVRLSREGTVVKEADLDPAVRAMQAIEVDEAGGDFKLEVLATTPGTEKRWRELTVSELRVWGRAGGASENPSHLPKMTIGRLDGTRPATAATRTQPTPGPFASTAELCKAYDRASSPAIDAAFPGDRYPGKIEGPHCRVRKDPGAADAGEQKKLAALAQGPFRGGSFVVFDDVEAERARLVLETAAGFSRTNVELWSRHHDDPGCLHGSHHELEDARLHRTSTGQDVLVVRVVHRDVRWMQMDPSLSGSTWVEKAYACRLDERGTAVCDPPLITGRAHEDFPAGISDPSDRRLYVIDVAKTPWSFRREPVLGPAGDLRLAP